MVALRASHMHELAMLNGTLRDIDMKCLNCGREGHKTWQCPESENVTARYLTEHVASNQCLWIQIH